MVSGQRGLPGAHALKEMFHVTESRVVPERAQTPRLRSVARIAVVMCLKRFYAS